MRTLIKTLAFALAALILVLAFACNSGGSGDTTSSQPDGSGDSVSADPSSVLSASADSFQDDVESVQAEMEFTMSAGGLDIDATAEMAFQAPDQMHMTMELTGLGSFEMLLLGSDIYMYIPPQGWVTFSLDELLGDLGAGLGDMGLDTESFDELFGDHSFVDYEALIESMGGEVEDLGEESLDGGTYRHYRGTIDFADIAAAFSDTFGVTEGLELDDVTGPMTFDAWVDTETLLPYTIAASGEFAFGLDSMVFDATMRFTGYNEPVDIPGAPADAVSFAELLSSMFQEQ